MLPNNGNFVNTIDQLLKPSDYDNIMKKIIIEKNIPFNNLNTYITSNTELNTNSNTESNTNTNANNNLNNKFINYDNQDLEFFNMKIKKYKIEELRNTIDQSWKIIDIVDKVKPYSWESVFEESFNELKEISESLENLELKGNIFPLKKDIFNAFYLCDLNKVSVVILGQDPYYSRDNDNNPTANGLSFSVRPNSAIPSTLINIFKELKKSIPNWTEPNINGKINGDLTHWTNQGILLLNTCLTVQEGTAKSHKKLWESFIDKVISEINKINPYCIYVLWGRIAENFMTKRVTNKNIVLISSHPSGNSAFQGFIGCNHFQLINSHLENLNKPIIKW